MAGHFIIPKKYYQFTFIALLILTVFTVLISRVDLGILNTPVALAVAIFKASLVGAFFMGLRWEKANLIFVFGGIAAMILFFLFTFIDLAYRGAINNEVQNPYNYKSPVNVIKDYSKGKQGSHK
jgi:cytochrome c oxidase subunit 4